MSEDTRLSTVTTPAPATPTHTSSITITESITTLTQEPAALATTKRKFHKLLDGLTRGPNKNAHPTNNVSTAKRIRLEARSRLDASTASNTSATSTYIQAQLLTTRLAAARTSEESGRPANPVAELAYQPWSHEHFLRRLKTFADLRRWTSKPDAINETQWAKRGWVCVDVNTVACKGGCEQRIVVGLRPSRKDEDGKEIEGSEDYSVGVEDELVRRYVELTTDGHDEACLWWGAGCRDDIYRLPIAKAAIWQPQLKERYLSFKAMSQHLPSPDNLSHSLQLDSIVAQLPIDFFNIPLDPTSTAAESAPPPLENTADQSAELSKLNQAALAFALLGWTGSPDMTLASCPACFRRLGLWLYTQPSTNIAAIDSVSNEATIKLDLLHNHRDYCPWINADSQCMQGLFAGLAGWEVLARLIRNNASTPAPKRPELVPRVSIFTESLNEDLLERQEIDRAGSESASIVTARKDAKEVEKEDKVRFARLKELTRAMGLRRRKKGMMERDEEGIKGSA